MFRKICAFVLGFSTFGVAVSAENLNQVVTSEVFTDFVEYEQQEEPVQQEYVEVVQEQIPTWPIAGSEVDVEVACGGAECGKKVVSKVGDGLVIENNVNVSGTGWSGGPNITSGIMIPAGFDYECANDTEMPLMNREMMEDDGGSVLAMSRSSHKHCAKRSDDYAVFAERAGFKPVSGCDEAVSVNSDDISDIAVNSNVEEEAPAKVQDQVRSWVVTNGQTLREVLKSWCDKEGWDLVWTTSREYPIEASAVFKGRFVDVASALIRNFERATPIPYAKFYKGNRVIVVSTTEE
ncbi:MAG: toxin co-regulated pilus biosynthesis Q family protein [Alphaproteobacteria bacterium]|nr:toxin co-regulated pilus biosynthesis Q family protein [Alphaproteobacteria bacterium]